MEKRFDDRISRLCLPPTAGDDPAVASVAPGREGWQLTRRTLMGLFAAGAFSRFPRAATPSPCAAGAYADSALIGSLSFFPDGNTLLSAGQDNLVKFWTIPSAALFRSTTTDAIPLQVAVSPDGSQIAVAMQQGNLQLWSADGSTRRSLTGHTAAVNAVAFTLNGAQLISVGADRTTKVWSVANATLIGSFTDAGDTMLQVAVPAPTRVRGTVTRPGKGAPAPTRQVPLFVTSGVQLYLRSLSSGEILWTAPGMAFAISRDGRFLAAHDASYLYMYAFPSMTLLTRWSIRAAPLRSLSARMASCSLLRIRTCPRASIPRPTLCSSAKWKPMTDPAFRRR
jgi:hypothetical protein